MKTEISVSAFWRKLVGCKKGEGKEIKYPKGKFRK